MELLGILRLLSRRRLLVAIGAVVAIAIGVLATGLTTQTSGKASARVMLDTANSQLTHGAPSGGDTLTWRSVILAYLAGSRALTDRIADQAGIRRNQLVVVYPTLEDPWRPAALPSKASEVANVVPEKYVLTVTFDELIPIISLKAEAPDRRASARLAAAAVSTLEEAATPTQVTPGIQGLAVESLGPVRSKAIVQRPQPLLGAAIALVLFGLWVACVAFIPLFLDALRRSRAPAARLNRYLSA